MKSIKIKRSVSRSVTTREEIHLDADQVETILRKALKLGTKKLIFHWPGYSGEEGNGSCVINCEDTDVVDLPNEEEEIVP